MEMRNTSLLVKICLLLFFVTYQSQCVFSQEKTINYGTEMRFSEHLMHQNLYGEAIFVLENLEKQKANFSFQQQDSIYYFLGFNHYNLKELQVSANYFTKVSKQAAMYEAAFFFAAYNHTFLEKYDSSKYFLQQFHFADSTLYKELHAFELSGIALLERDFETFEQLQNAYSFQHYQLEKQEVSLQKAYSSLQVQKHKSPAIAALLSALVPGLGRVYAGKAKQGVATFLPVALLALQTQENIRKRGWKNPFTIFYSGLFTVFYVGNIWGSAFSVKIKKDEFNQAVNHQILFDLHLPLRTIFN
ncbi:MAG: hypothetical protein ACPG5B_01790 [Chitinophagales bacterium]